jgi:hypothetical protein
LKTKKTHVLVKEHFRVAFIRKQFLPPKAATLARLSEKEVTTSHRRLQKPPTNEAHKNSLLMAAEDESFSHIAARW